jgi:hypothetical protein
MTKNVFLSEKFSRCVNVICAYVFQPFQHVLDSSNHSAKDENPGCSLQIDEKHINVQHINQKLNFFKTCVSWSK